MTYTESSNVPRLHKTGAFLRSKIAKLRTSSPRKKLTALFMSLVTLLAVPTAVFAVQGLISSSNNSGNPGTSAASLPATDTPASEPNTTSLSSSSATSSEEGGTTNKSNSSTQVIVNGESVPVPENGSVHKTINTNDGQVNVDVDNRTTNNSTTNSFTSVHSSSTSTNSSVSVSNNVGGTN